MLICVVTFVDGSEFEMECIFLRTDRPLLAQIAIDDDKIHFGASFIEFKSRTIAEGVFERIVLGYIKGDSHVIIDLEEIKC